MDPPSFTRKILKEELRISENELNKYQRILAQKAQKITHKLNQGEDELQQSSNAAEVKNEEAKTEEGYDRNGKLVEEQI